MTKRPSASCGWPLEPYAATGVRACGIVGDEFDAAGVKRCHQLHQRIDIAADHAVARLHSLDGRERQAGQLGELALVDAKQRTRGTKLCSSNHVSSVISYAIIMDIDHCNGKNTSLRRRAGHKPLFR